MADDSPQFRLHILVVVAFSLFGVLVARLWFLQVVNAQEFQVEAASQVTRVVHEQGPRGTIRDREGRVLAEDRTTTVVSVDRLALDVALDDDERDAMLLRLAIEINRSGGLVKVADIDADLADTTYSRFDEVPIAYDVSEELLIYVGERQDEFPGVSVAETTVRHYPYGNLAAHVLGYVGPINETELASRQDTCDPGDDPDCKAYQPGDDFGKSGIERRYEDVLRGHPGTETLYVDRQENVVGIGPRVAPRPGEDVWLTIDIDLQAIVEAELAATLVAARDQEPRPDEPEFRAPAGAAVILDPQDGRVLAMASYPTYDPAAFIGGISQREFSRLNDPLNHSPILNRAIQGAYAPGSTFKLVTGYGAIADGVIGPQGLFDVDEGAPDTGTYIYPFCQQEAEDIDSCRFDSPFEGDRSVDMAQALTVSSDVYFYRIGAEGYWLLKNDVSDEGIQAWARALGLGSTTGIALPFERAGVVPDRELFRSRFEENPGVFLRGTWQAGDTINLSIGQGDLLVTPLQMANLYASFATDVRHAPNIVLKTTDGSGDLIQDFGPRVLQELDTPPDIRDALTRGLIGVTNQEGPRGTAFAAFNLPGVGGADVPLERWPVLGKTGTAQVNGKADSSWFVAVGPVPNPELPLTASVEPRYAMSVILEESGFGSRAAAPMVARVFERLASGDALPRALTSEEREACYVAQDLEALDAEASDGEAPIDDGVDPCDASLGRAVSLVFEGTD